MSSCTFLNPGQPSPASIASTDLLSHVEPLQMDQLILHDTQTVCNWPNNAQSELFAVARRDIAVARRNLTSLNALRRHARRTLGGV